MSFAPLLNAPTIIQFHVVAALIALVLGPFAIHRSRRDRLHKQMGYVWVTAMLAVALTGVFIPSHDFAVIGHFGPIHLFVLLVLWSLFTGMRAIYRRDIAAHKAALRGLYWQGLAIAALVNFIPGRRVNRSLFPDSPESGWWVIALGGLALAAVAIQQSRQRRATRTAASL